MKHAIEYRYELDSLHHRRVYHIILVGSTVMLLFSLLDFMYAPEHFSSFLRYRLAVVFIGGVLLTVLFCDKRKRYALYIGFCGYTCAGLAILAMISQMDGVASSYYVGLIVIMTIYSALAPLTMGQALVAGFFMVSAYFLLIFLPGQLSDAQLMTLFNNLFFMVCFVLIIATQSWTETAARKREFELRMEVNDAAQELARQASLLEKEVSRRSAEREKAEKRYRLLFDHIADAVAVINEGGELLQFNTAFARHFPSHAQRQPALFYDCLPEPERYDLEKKVRSCIRTATPLTAFRVIMQTRDGGVLDAEINGSPLPQKDRTSGMQLIIRDLTIRKKLEQQLVISLQTIKQTESATILVLAKLSEYRDVTPENHLERIREYCRTLAIELSRKKEFTDLITPSFIQDIYHGSILHDIGKVSIPDALLNPSAPLTEQEQEMLRRHTIAGGDVIKAMEDESKGGGFLGLAKTIAYFHHERWDGKGYPHGLKREEVPLAARIMALADAYEEMTARGDGQPPLSHRDAVQSILGQSGHHFDPQVVEAFLNRQQKFNAIHLQFPEQVQQAINRVPGAAPGQGSEDSVTPDSHCRKTEPGQESKH